MDLSFPILTVLVVFPLLAAALLWAVPALRRSWRAYGIGVSLVELVFVAIAIYAFNMGAAGTIQLTEQYAWIPAIGTSWALGVNGLGLVMIVLASFLVPLVILARSEGDGGNPDWVYVALVLVLQACMVLIFAARDVLLFYIVFEAMLIPVYFLIGYFGGPNRKRAALKFLLYSLAGGLVMLVGVVALYVVGPGGETAYLMDSLEGLALDPMVERLLFVSFFIAFAIKAPMVPVHTWLPDTAQEADSGTSTLLVGILDKVGTFGMIMLCLVLFPNASRWAAPVIIILAVISILWGALVAIASKDFMRLVSMTSVSHFGFIVLGIFIGSTTAMTGAMIYMVAHGLSTAGLFLVLGFLAKRGGTQQIAAYRGMQRITPLIAGLFLTAGLASIALPGLSGFIPEYLVLVGTFAVNPIAAAFAVFGVILAALYLLLPYQRMFTGPPEDGIQGAADLSGREKAVMAPLIASMLLLGFVPGLVLDAVTPVAEAITPIVQVEGS
ncbi:MAG: NADH-quinone oxidoreductase subunit M [Ruaniaceae bacterium]|nr:NADH-quinone oxidoreductase subunit M [Ruaniaceae bacterium]